MSKIINISKVSELTGVSIKTLKIWDNEGKLNCAYKTAGGHRRYRLEDIEDYINVKKIDITNKVFIYCRVSTRKQAESGNLLRQKERLMSYCTDKNYDIVGVFEEIASGLNDARRELIKMFKKLSEVNKIIIEYPDRLAQFGYNYIKEFCKTLNVDIEIVEDNKKLESNEEMVNDLISVVTCFSARLYGSRGGRKVKNALEKSLKELEGSENSETNYESSTSKCK